MIKAHHQSAINTFSKCGIQYRKRYIEQVPMMKSLAPMKGTAIHAVNELVCKGKMDGTTYTISDKEDVARTSLNKEMAKGFIVEKGQNKEEEVNKTIDSVVAGCAVYETYIEPVLPDNIIGVEKKFFFNIQHGGVLGLPIAGVWDILADEEVVDIKTANSVWGKGREQVEFQVPMYSIAAELETGKHLSFRHEFVIMRKSGTLAHDSRVHTATDRQKQNLKNRIALLEQHVKAGIYAPAESSWICTPLYCGYYNDCKYAA